MIEVAGVFQRPRYRRPAHSLVGFHEFPPLSDKGIAEGIDLSLAHAAVLRITLDAAVALVQD